MPPLEAEPRQIAGSWYMSKTGLRTIILEWLRAKLSFAKTHRHRGLSSAKTHRHRGDRNKCHIPTYD